MGPSHAGSPLAALPNQGHHGNGSLQTGQILREGALRWQAYAGDSKGVSSLPVALILISVTWTWRREGLAASGSRAWPAALRRRPSVVPRTAQHSGARMPRGVCKVRLKQCPWQPACSPGSTSCATTNCNCDLLELAAGWQHSQVAACRRCNSSPQTAQLSVLRADPGRGLHPCPASTGLAGPSYEAAH